ncbi:biopolymer transporter ExbD [Anaeromyxobacter oryzisoli]|uniref:biopolymer transporter ExbD n=1 Tax=Anaeromyxobacter oryzisoli TaxID=2925408 RepID=UPI001F57BA8F|nr:biopolymer transporter ExbD [Anaeromyxobacter sp. SG63]
MATELGPGRRVAEINVTPLVDVVLVLLIVFMVLTPLAEKQKFLRVPEVEPDVQPVPPDAVPPDQTVLTALQNGRVRLNGQELAVEDAARLLHAAYDGRPSKVLFFDAEDPVRYEQAIQVLDAAHGAGVNTIGLMTDAPLAAGASAR